MILKDFLLYKTVDRTHSGNLSIGRMSARRFVSLKVAL